MTTLREFRCEVCGLVTTNPHRMIMWPFDPKTTELPTTHKPNRRLHHVGRMAVRACAPDGTPVKGGT